MDSLPRQLELLKGISKKGKHNWFNGRSNDEKRVLRQKDLIS